MSTNLQLRMAHGAIKRIEEARANLTRAQVILTTFARPNLEHAGLTNEVESIKSMEDAMVDFEFRLRQIQNAVADGFDDIYKNIRKDNS